VSQWTQNLVLQGLHHNLDFCLPRLLF